MIKLLCVDNGMENAIKDNLLKWYYIAIDKVVYVGVPHGEENICGCEIRLTTGEVLLCVEERSVVFNKLSTMWVHK